MGALNLYSTQPDAFDDRDVAVATVFAAHAAVAWSTSQAIENLKAGMVTRQLIGQAVGLLMVRQDMSEADALDALRRASQRLNIKLRAARRVDRASRSWAIAANRGLTFQPLSRPRRPGRPSMLPRADWRFWDFRPCCRDRSGCFNDGQAARPASFGRSWCTSCPRT